MCETEEFSVNMEKNLAERSDSVSETNNPAEKENNETICPSSSCEMLTKEKVCKGDEICLSLVFGKDKHCVTVGLDDDVVDLKHRVEELTG